MTPDLPTDTGFCVECIGNWRLSSSCMTKCVTTELTYAVFCF